MNKKLKKSSNKMIAGVCAGIAEYLGLDVTLVRVAYVLLSIFSAGFPRFDRLFDFNVRNARLLRRHVNVFLYQVICISPSFLMSYIPVWII